MGWQVLETDEGLVAKQVGVAQIMGTSSMPSVSVNDLLLHSYTHGLMKCDLKKVMQPATEPSVTMMMTAMSGSDPSSSGVATATNSSGAYQQHGVASTATQPASTVHISTQPTNTAGSSTSTVAPAASQGTAAGPTYLSTQWIGGREWADDPMDDDALYRTFIPDHTDFILNPLMGDQFDAYNLSGGEYDAASWKFGNNGKWLLLRDALRLTLA